MRGQRPGLLGVDEPVRVLQMVQSLEDVRGYDYLVEWAQPEESVGGERVWVSPSLVAGEQLVTEAPYLYRDFVERKCGELSLQRRGR